jgi:hypothetical protein
MLQRIQTIFLVLAAACSLGLWAFPFATAVGDLQASTLLHDETYTLTDNPALMGAFSIGALLSVIAIFLFKNRFSQTRVAIFAFIANFIGMILVVVLFFNDTKNQGTATVNDGLGAYLPTLAMIFILVALRFIKKDENIVRSMDRLR